MNRDNSFENRPLPTPPETDMGPGKDNAMFGDRYSYFKSEIQKWRSDLKSNKQVNSTPNTNAQPNPGRKFVMPNNENISPNVLRDIDSGRQANFLGD